MPRPDVRCSAGLNPLPNRWRIQAYEKTWELFFKEAYANSGTGPLVYDDLSSIANNPTLRPSASAFRAFFPPADGRTVSGRPVLNLSLALNYANGQLAFRLTVGLRKIAGQWTIFHEHHSIPAT